MVEEARTEPDGEEFPEGWSAQQVVLRLLQVEELEQANPEIDIPPRVLEPKRGSSLRV